MSTRMELIENFSAPVLFGLERSTAASLSFYPALPGGLSTIKPLTDDERAEVLEFLAPRPMHTIIMSGLIHDYGLESRDARGAFYGVRSEYGRLEGVALIGRTTTFEVNSKKALYAIARKARQSAGIGFVIGEEKKFELFWRYYTGNNQPLPKRLRGELLYELTRDAITVEECGEASAALRVATSTDLEQVVNAHAEMTAAEWGINPLETDWQGFRERCARRIAQGRVWLMTENDRLIFKADLAARTPETAYLEGIYVNPDSRGRNIGTRCLTQLNKILLGQARNICLLVDESNHGARRLYDKCGYQLRSHYSSISVL